jgi:hypothetical protein
MASMILLLLFKHSSKMYFGIGKNDKKHNAIFIHTHKRNKAKQELSPFNFLTDFPLTHLPINTLEIAKSKSIQNRI